MDGARAISGRQHATDRREQPRQKIDDESTLIDLQDGRGPMTCRIWDISPVGACILVPPNVSLPGCFKIHLKGSWQNADVVWRRDWHVGIQFGS